MRRAPPPGTGDGALDERRLSRGGRSPRPCASGAGSRPRRSGTSARCARCRRPGRGTAGRGSGGRSRRSVPAEEQRVGVVAAAVGGGGTQGAAEAVERLADRGEGGGARGADVAATGG